MSNINLSVTAAQLNAAGQTAHTHNNKAVLDDITSTDITSWNAKQSQLTSSQLAVLNSGITTDILTDLMEVYNWYNDVIVPTLSDGKMYLLKNGDVTELTGGMVWTANSP